VTNITFKNAKQLLKNHLQRDAIRHVLTENMNGRRVTTANQRTIPRAVRVPIRMKLTLPYLVLSLILAAAAAYLITGLVVENVEERFDKQLFEAGRISSELVVSHESRLLESLRLLANVEGVPAAILSKDANRLRLLTLGIAANNQLEAAEFFDLNGNHVLSLRQRVGGNVEDYEYSTGGQTQYSNLALVQNILAQKSDSKGDKFADLFRADKGNYIYISGPIYDAQRNLAGVILVGESLAHMAQEMRAQTFAQITFYDDSGEVINSTLPFPQRLNPETSVQVISFKDLNSTKRNLSNQRDFEASNLAFAEILGAFEVRSHNELGVLGVALSRNALVQTSHASRWQIFLLVATANFLIILVGINLANQITRPLLRLVQASVKVTEGDLNVKVAPQSNDEISVLTESFNAMVASLRQSQTELVKTYDDTLEGWAKALELRDKETEGHSERVTSLAVRLAEALGIQGDALLNIRRGALLHDIGKMGTPDAILHKDGALTKEERLIIQKHPQDAYNMLKQIGYLQSALEIPYCHHEKWDGSGYPRGLRGEEIPISARIFSIVDVWDALTNDRPYRRAQAREAVIRYLRNESGRHFDPRVANAFIQMLEKEG
jgi:putative nucleotidyltransferase with HDIG domain